MKRVLITSVGGDVANAIVRSLLDVDNLLLFGCDIRDYVPDMHQFHYTIVPRYDSEDYWPALQKLLLSQGITHFIPTSEPEICIMDSHRAFFQHHHIALIINHPHVIHTCTSKYRTAKFLLDHGIPAPATWLPGELPDPPVYPLVVKPDSGRGSAGVSIARCKAELDAAIQNIPHPVIQQYVGSPDDEYTVGVFSDGSTTHSICFQRSLGYGGMSVRVQTRNIPRLHQTAIKVAQAFHLVGAINLQLRWQDNQAFIFEINPRLSSTVGFRHKLGFQDALWWLHTLDHIPIPGQYSISDGIVGLKTLNEQIIYTMKQEIANPLRNPDLRGGGGLKKENIIFLTPSQPRQRHPVLFQEGLCA